MTRQIRDLISALNSISESKNFVIHYCMRDPRMGRGYGRRGVADLRLIVCYIENLERLFATLTGPPINWARKPLRKIPVYLLDLDDLPERSPLAGIDDQGHPYVVLPCRSSEPSLQMAHQRAAVEAIHEATHAFSFTARNLHSLSDQEYIASLKWHWFNEATSVFMEGLLMPTNPESIRFARDWSDSPHISLDDPTAEYASGMFARYIARRFGAHLIADVWNQSTALVGPFEILDLLISSLEPALKSPDPRSICPIFREYCIDSYFVWDHDSVGFAADVYARFGNRAIAHSLVPKLGSPLSIPDVDGLNHLSCRYYRVWLDADVSSLVIELDANHPEIHADAAVIMKNMQHDKPQPANPNSTLGSLDPQEIDHVIVVVSNTGIGGRHDALTYTLKFSAT